MVLGSSGSTETESKTQAKQHSCGVAGKDGIDRLQHIVLDRDPRTIEVQLTWRDVKTGRKSTRPRQIKMEAAGGVGETHEVEETTAGWRYCGPDRPDSTLVEFRNGKLKFF